MNFAARKCCPTSELIIPNVESEEYQWEFKIPPRSSIQEHMRLMGTGGGLLFEDLKFKTGILSDVDHSLIFAVYSNQINVHLKIPRNTRREKYDVMNPAILELWSHDIEKSTKELKLTCEGVGNSQLFTGTYSNSDSHWDDSVDRMKIKFWVQRQKLAVPLHGAHPEALMKLIKTIESPPMFAKGLFVDLFLSTDLSDVSIVCGQETFPCHRVVLRSQSIVFKKMFEHSMKENQERSVFVEDVDAEVMRELLRFLYCGRVEALSRICPELFIAANKYEVSYLKDLCELSLIENLNVGNAMSMFGLGSSHNGLALMQKSLLVLRSQKESLISDSKTLQEFAITHPELLFNLLQQN